MSDTDRSASSGWSRRQVLTRSAAAAGVVWAAPVIRTTKAYAVGGAGGTERPCTHFYVVCLDRRNRPWPLFPDGRCNFPGSWSPQPVGNGWPRPWDGTGVPPWAGSGDGRNAATYTYGFPGGPGRSVSFAAVPADATTPTGAATPATATASSPPAATVGGAATTSTTAPTATGGANGGDPNTDVLSIFGATGGSPSTAAGVVDPEVPDADQFGSRIGADLPDPLPPTILDWVHANPGIVLERPPSYPAVTQTSPDAWACLLPAPPNLPDWWSRRCRLVVGVYKNGNDFGDDGFAGPDAPGSPAYGRRLTFPCRPVRHGGYLGREGQPGDFRKVPYAQGGTPDPSVGTSATSALDASPAAVTGGPGKSVAFGRPDPNDAPRTRYTDPTMVPKPPVDPTAIDPTVVDPTLLACTPDPALHYPWNLDYPKNLEAYWDPRPRKHPLPLPPDTGACLPPPVLPARATAADPPLPAGTTGAPRPSKQGQTRPRQSSTTSTPTTSTTTTTTTTTRPAAPSTTPAPGSPAPAAPPAVDSQQVDGGGNRNRYPHHGHFGEHECVVLVYCCP